MNDQAIADIGRNVAGKMQELMQREVNIALHVLDHLEVSYLLMRLAVSVGGGAILGAMQSRKEETSAEQVYDEFARAIHEGMLAVKPEYLEKLAEIEATRESAAP